MRKPTFRPDDDITVTEDLSGTEIVMDGSRGAMTVLLTLLYVFVTSLMDASPSHFGLIPLLLPLFFIHKHFRFTAKTLHTHNSVGPVTWNRRTIVCSEVQDVATSSFLYVFDRMTVIMKDGTRYHSFSGSEDDHKKLREMILQTGQGSAAGSVDDVPDDLTKLGQQIQVRSNRRQKNER